MWYPWHGAANSVRIPALRGLARSIRAPVFSEARFL